MDLVAEVFGLKKLKNKAMFNGLKIKKLILYNGNRSEPKVLK